MNMQSSPPGTIGAGGSFTPVPGSAALNGDMRLSRQDRRAWRRRRRNRDLRQEYLRAE